MDKTATAPGNVDVEAIMAAHVARRAVWVAPVLVAVFGLLRGWSGAWAAGVGVAVVVGNFLLSGWALSIAARISLAFYQAAALFGFILRLILITVSLLVLGSLTELDRLALGLSVVIAYLVLLSWEAIAVARGKERELDWT
ncbi:MAG: hypothetical protein HKN74_04820 [Acidimicrobiia bacterium]|nr:hypothetical protein [Acidimicrobiia bacterium]NNF09588.1 hypothetical protein [Acidimicrobiia bacterium]NNL69583.1 hypothetical protein [Acidimicrobiia bacterium]